MIEETQPPAALWALLRSSAPQRYPRGLSAINAAPACWKEDSRRVAGTVRSLSQVEGEELGRLVEWIVGSIVLATLISCGGRGGGEETSPVPPECPLAQSISKLTGDGQITPPGTAVAVAPVVYVQDTLGAAMRGVAVTFEVTEGGGSVESKIASTDAAGRASPGTWTLGAASGRNTLSASVAGLASVTFSATAANAAADVKVSVLTPLNGQTVGETMTVAAAVTSTHQLSSVVAYSNGKSVPLTYGPYGRFGQSAWSGVLSFAGQPRGDVEFVVTARDIVGHATDVFVAVRLDRAPVVSVSAPLEGTVARPKTDVVATCADDDPAGCASLTATVHEEVVATGKDSISRLVDFSAYEGQHVSLVITGVDSIGQRTTVARSLFIESSAHLTVRVAVGGPVWDASGTRILFLDLEGPSPALRIFDTAAGTTQMVETGADLVGTWGGYGFLTPTGALYVHGKVDGGFPYAWLYEWRAGTVTNLGGLNSSASLHMAGNWALYSAQELAGRVGLWRRDLVAGVSSLLTEDAGNVENDVASTGDVVYWSDDSGALGRNTFLLRNGTTQALTNDPYAALWNTYPVTDGVNVVYRKHTPCCAAPTYRIAVHDGSTETILTAATAREPTPGRDYAVAGGHVAYAAEDIAKVSQIWRFGPAGDQQLTFFGSSSHIDAMAMDGSVLLTHEQKRYLAAPGAPLREMGSSLGRVIIRDGKFLVLIDRTVLEVLP